MEPKHIQELNKELEAERRGRAILPTIKYIFLTTVFLTLGLPLILLNADFIDAIFEMWQVQVGFVLLLLIGFVYIWIRIRI
jgi:hypothetical protein